MYAEIEELYKGSDFDKGEGEELSENECDETITVPDDSEEPLLPGTPDSARECVYVF